MCSTLHFHVRSYNYFLASTIIIFFHIPEWELKWNGEQLLSGKHKYKVFHKPEWELKWKRRTMHSQVWRQHLSCPSWQLIGWSRFPRVDVLHLVFSCAWSEQLASTSRNIKSWWWAGGAWKGARSALGSFPNGFINAGAACRSARRCCASAHAGMRS